MSFDVLSLLAQDDAATGGGFAGLLMPLLVIFILYIFLIQRPQQREKMRRENDMNALKKGDKVVTIGGICGKIDSIDKTTGRITLLVDKNTRLEFLKAAVDRLDKGPKEKAAGGKGDGGKGEDAKSESDAADADAGEAKDANEFRREKKAAK